MENCKYPEDFLRGQFRIVRYNGDVVTKCRRFTILEAIMNCNQAKATIENWDIEEYTGKEWESIALNTK